MKTYILNLAPVHLATDDIDEARAMAVAYLQDITEVSLEEITEVK